MTMMPAREWICDGCPAKEVQIGPRAAELLPSPPPSWTVVDVTTIIPARMSGGQKVGEARQTDRMTFCGPCSERLLRDFKAGKVGA